MGPRVTEQELADLRARIESVREETAELEGERAALEQSVKTLGALAHELEIEGWERWLPVVFEGLAALSLGLVLGDWVADWPTGTLTSLVFVVLFFFALRGRTYADRQAHARVRWLASQVRERLTAERARVRVADGAEDGGDEEEEHDVPQRRERARRQG